MQKKKKKITTRGKKKPHAMLSKFDFENRETQQNISLVIWGSAPQRGMHLLYLVQFSGLYYDLPR